MTTNTKLTPLTGSQRILFLDSLRGIALLGILLMNIMSQALPHPWYSAMDYREPMTGPNYWAWFTEVMFFEGTMRGLFSLLFGAGSLLLLSRLVLKAQGLEPADLFMRRMLWLLVFGMLNGFIFLWPGDILYSYAICGILIFPFRNLSSRALLIVSFVLLLIGTYRENSDLYQDKKTIRKGLAVQAIDTTKTKLTDQQKEDLGKFMGFKGRNTKEGIAKASDDDLKQVQNKSLPAIYHEFESINMYLESMGFYNFMWYDVLLMMFAGMGLFKLGYFGGTMRTWTYLLVAVVGIGAGLLLNHIQMQTQYGLKFDNYQFTRQWIFNYYQPRRLMQTLGYLSLLILLYKLVPFRKLLHVLAPVGQMAFSNYLGQSIITTILFHALHYYGKFQRYEIYYVVGAIWLFQILFSHLWLRFFLFGPFEWVWRSLTYRQRQPMRRPKLQAVLPVGE